MKGAVEIRAAQSDSFAAAARGSIWDISAQLQTGEDGWVRLNLVDGIYLRLAPNTSLTNQSSSSEWQLGLERGILWSILNARGLSVITPLGRAWAEGTAAAFRYSAGDPATSADDVWVIQCLRGSCRFEGEGKTVALGDLGQLTVAAGGASVEQSTASRADVDDFITNNSEALRLLVNQRAAAPAPSATAASGSELTPSLNGSKATVTMRPPTATVNLTAVTATRTASATATATASATATATPTSTATRTATATARPTRRVVPTQRPTDTPLALLELPTDTPQPSGPGEPPSRPPDQPPAPTEPPPPPPERTAPPPKP